MLSRATEAGDRVPSVTKTQLILTITATDLANGTEAGEVLGSLNTGLLLGTETVRKLTCDGSVTPVVLDDSGNLLHLGRTRRLFSSTQLKALWLRDKHCTYPGCDTPPTGATPTTPLGRRRTRPTSTTRHCSAATTTPSSTPDDSRRV